MTEAPSIAELKERADFAQQLIETHQLEAIARNVRLANALSLQEAWDDPGNYVDPREWQTDDYGRPLMIGGMGSLGAQRSDRKDGDYRPFFETEAELASIRAKSRWLGGANALGVGVLEKLTDYVIGTGFTFKCEPVEEGQTAAEIALLCQEVIERFIEDNDWQGDADREIFIRSRRDGEAFPVLYPRADGGTILRIIEPEQVVEPAQTRDLDDRYGDGNACTWTWGVHTAAGDVQRVLGYYVQWSDSAADYDYLPASMVEHIKLNVDRTIKRGLSDFYPVLARLERCEKLLRNTEEGAAIQAAIAYIVEAAQGVSKAAAESAQFARADYQTPVSGSQTTRTRFTKKLDPGTVLTVASGQQYKPGPMGAERAPNFMIVLQAAMRWIGNRWSMPEFLVSGDASNANYASTMVAESPWVKSCQAKQHLMKRKFANIMWRVIGNAIKAGKFNAFGFWSMDASAVEQLKKLVKLDIEAPQLEVRDKTAETARRKTLADAGILSDKTWTAQEGEDWETEQDNIAKQPKPQPVLMPGQTPPGQPSGPQQQQESAHDRLSRAAGILWEGYPA